MFIEAEKKLFSICKTQNLGLIAKIPLAKGILSGKYSIDHVFESTDHRNRFGEEVNKGLIAEALKIKKNEVGDYKMSEWSIAWCLKNKIISTVIPGCKNINQLKSNINSYKLINQE